MRERDLRPVLYNIRFEHLIYAYMTVIAVST